MWIAYCWFLPCRSAVRDGHWRLCHFTLQERRHVRRPSGRLQVRLYSGLRGRWLLSQRLPRQRVSLSKWRHVLRSQRKPNVSLSASVHRWPLHARQVPRDLVRKPRYLREGEMCLSGRFPWPLLRRERLRNDAVSERRHVSRWRLSLRARVHGANMPNPGR